VYDFDTVLPCRTGDISYLLQYALFLKFGNLYSLS